MVSAMLPTLFSKTILKNSLAASIGGGGVEEAKAAANKADDDSEEEEVAQHTLDPHGVIGLKEGNFDGATDSLARIARARLGVAGRSNLGGNGLGGSGFAAMSITLGGA